MPEQMGYFKTKEMLQALRLELGSDGSLWAYSADGQARQRLEWSPEMAIAFVVGQMLDETVREDIQRNAVAPTPESVRGGVQRFGPHAGTLYGPHA